MKKFLPLLSLAFVFAACSTKQAETEVKTLQSANQSPARIDTAGLAQFQQWKSQNELNATDIHEQTVAQTPVKEVTIIRERIVERQRPVKQAPQKLEVPVIAETENSGSGTNETVTGSGTSNGTIESTTPTPEVSKKEGWSKAAKGAVIGGAGGAVLGAIINKKNPAVGAAIGGVLGGTVGYGIGRNKDKKDQRY